MVKSVYAQANFQIQNQLCSLRRAKRLTKKAKEQFAYVNIILAALFGIHIIGSFKKIILILNNRGRIRRDRKLAIIKA